MKPYNRAPEYSGEKNSILQSVLSQLSKAIWQMDEREDGSQILADLRTGLKALGIPFEGCGIFFVEQDISSPSVRFHSMHAKGSWQPTTRGMGRDLILQIWKAGVPFYRRDLGREDKYREKECLARVFGYPVRCGFDIPFTHGTLAINSSVADVFTSRDIKSTLSLAALLSVLFYRLQDLAEMKARDEQIRQVQSMAMVGQLAAGATHEINNALMAILGYGELLLAEKLAPPTSESVNLMYHAAQQVQNIVAILQNLANRQRMVKEYLDLNQLIRDMILLLHTQLEREQVEIIDDLAEDLPPIEGHAGQIQQIVLNLIQNSRDAILESSSWGMIIIRTFKDEDSLALEVQDDGPGIPLEIAERIFEPFFTTKKAASGTGLGLSVCQEIAKGHKGSIRAKKHADGARVVVEFCLE